MNVFELNRDQLDELKSALYWGDDTQNLPAVIDAMFPENIPDAVVFDCFAGVSFTPDDFTSSVNF